MRSQNKPSQAQSRHNAQVGHIVLQHISVNEHPTR